MTQAVTNAITAGFRFYVVVLTRRYASMPLSGRRGAADTVELRRTPRTCGSGKIYTSPRDLREQAASRSGGRACRDGLVSGSRRGRVGRVHATRPRAARARESADATRIERGSHCKAYHHPLLVAVARQTERRGSYRLKLDAGFVATSPIQNSTPSSRTNSGTSRSLPSPLPADGTAGQPGRPACREPRSAGRRVRQGRGTRRQEGHRVADPLTTTERADRAFQAGCP